MTANDFLRSDLIARATISARNRGHQLRSWVPLSRYSMIADCVTCGAEVEVNAMPRPNEAHIGGPAVALNCRSEV